MVLVYFLPRLDRLCRYKAAAAPRATVSQAAVATPGRGVSSPTSTASPLSETKSRGVKRERSPSPVLNLEQDENEEPRVLDPKNLSRLEKQKIRRIVMPKPGSGNLEVPPNFMKMWEQAGTQRDQLFSMWAKAGGVKVGGAKS